MLLVESKDFNALIDNKPYLDQLVKKNKKHMKNDDYTTGDLFDDLYHQKY